MEFHRTRYLQKMEEAIGNGMVKIITGPRRCGKSYLLFRLFCERLKERGVSEDHILCLSLDAPENLRYRNVFEFISYFKERHHPNDGTYFFLIDEIQLVSPSENPWVKGDSVGFVDALNGFLHLDHVEIFVTGSNSRMLSSDISTEFRGRGWQIPLHPLSFSEIREQMPSSYSDEQLWKMYYEYGGLPQAVKQNNEEARKQYLESVFQTTYLKDIAERNGLRKEMSLREVTSVVASSVGSLISPAKLSRAFASKGNAVGGETIKRYLVHLEDAFLLRGVRRYDLRGKAYIEGAGKYYFEDLGIRSAATSFQGMDQEPHFMENAIYNELILRGYSVYIGSLSSVESRDGQSIRVSREIDFIAEKGGQKLYIQSSMLILDEQKERQEKAPFAKLSDSFPRILITKTASGVSRDADGVLRIGFFDFLKDPRLLESL